MVHKVKDYYDKYNSHINSLIKLDDFMDNSNMTEIFTKYIIKDNFNKNKIDRGNPLLLRNYLVNGMTSQKSFKKEHVAMQIKYRVFKNFGEKDYLLIRDVGVKFTSKNKNSVYVTIQGIDMEQYSKTLSHNKLILNNAEANEFVKSTIRRIKKKIGNNSSSGLGNTSQFNNLVSENTNNMYRPDANNYSNGNNIYGSIDLIGRGNTRAQKKNSKKTRNKKEHGGNQHNVSKKFKGLLNINHNNFYQKEQV